MTDEDKKITEVYEVTEVKTENQDNDKKEPEKKNGFFSGLKKGFKKIVNEGRKMLNEVDEYFDKMPEKNALNRLFDEEATELISTANGRSRFAIIGEGGILTFRFDGDDSLMQIENDEIKAGAHFEANGKHYEILSVDRDTEVLYKKEGNTQSLKCFTATAKIS